MLSISYRFAVTGLFLVVALAGLAGVLVNAYSSTSTALLRLSSEILGELSSRVVQRVGDIADSIESHLYVNAQLAQKHPNILVDPELLLRVFWQQVIHTDPVRAVYIADYAGNMVSVDQDPRSATRIIQGGVEDLVYRDTHFDPLADVRKASDYDPRTRDWFKDSGPDLIHWTEVYRFAFSEGQEDTKAQGITASLAVVDPRGRPRYVVAADVTLQSMSDFLSAQTISESVAMFIVDDRDRLVAYPYQLGLDAEYRSGGGDLPLVQALPQPWIQDAYTNYKHSTREDGKLLISRTGGELYVTTATSFGEPLAEGLRLIMVAPRSYLIASAYTMLRESLVVSLIILLLSLFVVYRVASYLSQPIQRLATNARLIQGFRFDELEPIGRRWHDRWHDVRVLDDALGAIAGSLRTLAKFVPAELLSKWLHGGEKIEAGSRVRELDLLCSVVADPLPPERLQQLLPQHFEALTDAIRDQRGTLDRFTGDGIQAFWGAPEEMAGGTRRACHSALRAVKEQDGRPDEVRIRGHFAIHSGPALVGSFGTGQRLSYTAVGDSVTACAALLALNRRYGTRIIISDAAYRRVSDAFQCRPLDRVRLDDAGSAVTIHELVADHVAQLPVDHRRFLEAYTLAFECYLRQAWEEALEQLGSIPETYRGDPSLLLLRSRCRGLADGSLPAPPAPGDWDGSYPSTTQS